jgi:hypothetical protein
MLFLPVSVKNGNIMKGSRNQANRQSKQYISNIPRPDNKDDLDSRERKDNNYTERSNKEGKKPNSRDKDKYGA